MKNILNHSKPKELMSLEQKEFEAIRGIKKEDKCCIVGFAPSWNEAPYKEKGIDFWGINELYLYLQQNKIDTPFSGWFEIHDIKNSPTKQKKQHQDFLKNCKIPLITQKHWDEYPASLAYPVKRVVDHFNENFIIDAVNEGFSDYSNQISWMIALAIMLDYKEIMVYGVDMAQESEYNFQRASCQFFLGYAAGAGIKLRIPKSCELIKCGKLYGFQSDNKNRFRKKKRIEVCNQSVEQISIRNSEIRYYQDKLKNKLDKEKSIVEADIEAIKTNEIENRISKIVSEAIINFLNSIPESQEDISRLKSKFIQINKSNLDKVNKELKALNNNKNKLAKKLDRLEADFYINDDLLKAEAKMNDQSKIKILGSIGECKHDLNNNLV